MAVLDAAQRQDALRHFIRRAFVETGARADFNTDDLIAAVDALDDWIESEGATVNAVLPQPFKGAATLEQKALLFAYVALKRGGVI